MNTKSTNLFVSTGSAITPLVSDPSNSSWATLIPRDTSEALRASIANIVASSGSNLGGHYPLQRVSDSASHYPFQALSESVPHYPFQRVVEVSNVSPAVPAQRIYPHV